MQPSQRIPVLLVCGPLGSGKSTAIARALCEDARADTLVIVNEFGVVDIPHDLLAASGDETSLGATGCLCCTIRGNLVDTLADALAQVASGRLGAFARVIVETSSEADPGAIARFLAGDAPTMASYRVAGIVTAVDATIPLATTDRALAQLLAADRLLITKRDLVGRDVVCALERHLAALNPLARVDSDAPLLRETEEGNGETLIRDLVLAFEPQHLARLVG
jgi:G3E family GTPase